jgi:divalent metal cation (Fe/Co/Zn/Cd) transporter
MSIFIIALGALIIVVLYSKEIDSKKENSQLGFYVVLFLIIIVILLFVANMLSE